MDEELKPCPFCGEAPRIEEEEDITGLICESCGFWWNFDGAGSFEEIKQETIHHWNQRPLEDALRAENERLRTALWQIYAVSREYAMYDVFRGFDKMQAIAKAALGA